MMNNEMKEGKLKFIFDKKAEVIKFDEDKFYREYFMKLPEAKGIDFIFYDSKNLIFLEIKDCFGYEKENLYRTKTNFFESKEVSFDIEVAKKVESTIACLIGAYTRKRSCETAEKLSKLCENLKISDIPKEKKQLWIILLLEGEFQIKTRTKKMIMKEIQQSLKQKLKWLECKVSVVDIETYKERFFKVERTNE